MKRNVAKQLTAIALTSLFVFSTTAFADNNTNNNANTNNTPNKPQGLLITENSITTEQAATSATDSGKQFLETNKAKPGVVTLPDGLQYKVIVAGKGDKPSDSDTVVVDYTGTLVNGTEFDSSSKHGGPATFPVNGVIPGWTEALKLMKTGSTWELYIPSYLAYGEAGAPPAIGPNETLIFKVKLIEVQKQS